jgi:hypothetical protein
MLNFKLSGTPVPGSKFMFKHTTFFLLVFLFLISSSRAQWITLPHAPLPVSGPPDFASIGFLDITAVGDGRLLYEVTVNDNHPGYYPSYGYKISYNDLRSGQDLIYTSPAFLNSFPPIKNMVYVNDSTFAMNQNIGQ